MLSSITPWSPYEGRTALASAGRITLTAAFADLVRIRAGFSPVDLPAIFAAPADEGENDACRDLVRLDAELLARKFVRGEIDTYIRPLRGGDVEQLKAEKWEIDDPLPRFATGALHREDWADPDALPTHRIFVDADQFERWLAALKPLGPLTVREAEAIVDPKLRVARSVAYRHAPEVAQEGHGPSPISDTWPGWSRSGGAHPA
jgi:hypothetical protein